MSSDNTSRSTMKQPPSPQRERLARLRAEFPRLHLDSFLVSAPQDIRYLTGFCGEDSHALVSRRALYIVSDNRFEEELSPQRKFAHLIMRTTTVAERSATLISDLKLRRVGVQADNLTLASRAVMAAIAGSKRLISTRAILTTLRAVKDAAEIAIIRRAIRCQQQAVAATLKSLRPGQSESQVAARLEFEMMSRGASAAAFVSIVAAGPNGSMPHYRPRPIMRVRRGGQPLLIDWGARIDGYCSDMTRTWFLGKPTPRWRDIYRHVLDAQQAAIAAIRPGANCREIDASARKVITDAGFGANFGHGLGHGLGLDVHEQPSLSPRAAADAVLTEGMVVTVEPGIYIPGEGGVRIEDDVLVTKHGHSVLSDFPKSPEAMCL